MVERVFPAEPFLIGGGRIIPSPNQFYLTGEDRLRVVSANSMSGVSLKVQLRTANPQGDTIPHSLDHTPNTDRSIRTEDFAIGTGSILNATVFARTGAPKIGQTFVIVQLVRGAGAAAVVLGTLLSGYVTNTQALGFPGSPIMTSLESGGQIRELVGTLPGVGAGIIETVPTGARWDVLTAAFTFTTSAAAGNRVVTFGVQSAVGVFMRSVNVTPQGPSIAGLYRMSQGMQAQVYAPTQTWLMPWPTSLQILAGTSILVDRDFPGAGDQFSALSFIVREWLEVP